jgi:dienelactone hydrolase
MTTTRILPLLLFLVVAAPMAHAQERRMAFAAPAPDITVTSDVQYGESAGTRLAMDIYRRATLEGRQGAAARMPALVFFNRATGADRSQPFYAAWARAAASKGIIGILPDLRPGSEAADCDVLIAYLSQHASELGIDGIAVYAGSGNVFAALPFVEDPKQTAIKAAVMYYGSAPIAQFRLDLPVLYVRAGLDRPPVNESIASLAALAVAQNAPVTLLNNAGGHHAFELIDDNDATRLVIDQTLDFVKQATSAAYQSALRASLAEAAAAGYVQTRRFGDAVKAYAQIVAARPDDPRLRLAYGEALLGDGQYATACAEFDKLKDKGLGYRDLGLPAARACLAKGDPDAAVAWLKTIPSRFLPTELERDPAFAPLRSREDFKALFAGR